MSALSPSPVVYDAPVRISVAQENLTRACAKVAVAQQQAASSQLSLLQSFASEAEKGQVKTEHTLALHILPLVKDIHQMIALVDESVSRYDAATAANQKLRQLIAERASAQ